MKILKHFTSLPVISTAILAMVTYIGVVYAINTWDTGYQAPLWTNTDVIIGSAGGTCQRVYNGWGVASLFVPTNTVGEWNAFNSNKPSWVTVSSCCDPNMGNACDCTQRAFSCQPSPWTPDPNWCTSPGQYVWTYYLDWTWSPSSCGTYSAYVFCVQTGGGTVNCAGQCIDNSYWLECWTFNYNSPLP